MKNFFKKLSFVLAIAMVLTSVVPATTASAASKVQIELNGKAVTEVTAFFGGVVRNLDASKNGKAASGTWKVGNTKVATVDSKTGVITPVGEGTTKVAFTLKGEKKASASVYVKVRTRAAALHVYDPSEYATGTRNKLEDTTIELNVGEDKELKVTMPISKKASNAGAKISTYFLYADSSNEDVVKVSASTKMYTRAITLKPVAAGEATVTLFANQTTKANARANKYVKEAKFTVKVAGESKIASAEATKVNEVTVKFNGAADKDTVLALTNKSGNAVEHTVAWNEDNTVAILTTVAKMTNGTYTVTAKVADAASTATFEVKDQYVKEIKILNEVALTGKRGTGKTAIEAGEAYVYYQVLDQYEQDLTASTSIQWSTSTGVNPDVKRSEGKLTIKKGDTDTKGFTYGEQIYVTGVYTKTGVSVQATLTVGTTQALNTIEMKGFVKKNTTTLLKSLPNGFKSGEYYLVFDALDQNGNALPADAKYADGTEATFVVDNPLVISAIEKFDKTLVIDGHEYNAIRVYPGQFVDKGGEVNVTAIATKTGNKVVKNFVVGANQILTSFTMSAPTDYIADGESVEIPFTALDQNGEAITNFDSLARNLNKLTFTTSVGTTTLKEKNDGTASLTFQDIDLDWSDSRTTDGFDRPVSITSVVVGGNSDNLMIQVSDKARPDAIKAEAMDDVYAEGYGLGVEGKITVGVKKVTTNTTYGTFTFLDQYGRTMGNEAYKFFEATVKGGLSGQDFSGYVYNVILEYKGNSDAFTALENGKQYVIDLANKGNIKFAADTKTATVFADNSFSYTISRAKVANIAKADEYEATSTAFKKPVSVVDILQVKAFTVKDVKKLNINTKGSGYTTLAQFADQIGNNDKVVDTTDLNDTAAFVDDPVMNAPDVAVTGTYNNSTVKIPAVYYAITGDYVASAGSQYGQATISKVVTAIPYSYLYDVKSANYVRADFTSKIKVTVAERYDNIVSGTSIVGAATMGAIRDAVTKNVVLSDAAPVVSKIVTQDAYTFSPKHTKLTGAKMLYSDYSGIEWLNENVFGTCTLYDQYDAKLYDKTMYASVKNVDYDEVIWATKTMSYKNTLVGHNDTVNVSFKVSDIVEAAGYAENNFTVLQNDTAAMSIEGAEIGDTFKLTITAADKNNGKILVTKTVNVTVGADEESKLANSTNTYVDTLIGTATDADTADLESQRQATLK